MGEVVASPPKEQTVTRCSTRAAGLRVALANTMNGNAGFGRKDALSYPSSRLPVIVRRKKRASPCDDGLLRCAVVHPCHLIHRFFSFTVRAIRFEQLGAAKIVIFASRGFGMSLNQASIEDVARAKIPRPLLSTCGRARMSARHGKAFPAPCVKPVEGAASWPPAKDTEIFLHCGTGGRATRATAALVALGYRNAACFRHFHVDRKRRCGGAWYWHWCHCALDERALTNVAKRRGTARTGTLMRDSRCAHPRHSCAQPPTTML